MGAEARALGTLARPWRLAPLLLLWLPLRFPGALPGPRVVSADDHLSVHPVFQDEPGGRVRHPQLSDPALQFAALDQRTVAALRSGRAPLWNPELYGGAPLLANAQSRPGSPVTWLRVLLHERPALAQDLGVAWLLLWCGLGTFALVLALGLGGLPALCAGFAAMASPYLSVWLLHPHASTVVWLPWVLLALERRSAVALALAVAGLCAGGHPGTVVLCAVVAVAWGVARARELRLVLGGLAGALLAGPLLVPVYENALQSTTLEARVGSRLPAAQLLDLVWPGFWGHPVREDLGGPGAWADGQLHPGLAALGLALWGAWRRPMGRWLLAGFGLTVVVALVGLPGPFAASRAASLGAWLLCLGAAVGTAALPGRRLAVAAVVLVVGTGLHARWLDQSSLPAAEHAPAPAAWATRLREVVSEGPAGPGRVLGLGWMVQPNTGALAGLRDLRGYDLPVSWVVHGLMGALSQPPRGPWYPVETLPSRALLDFAAVRAVVSDGPLEGLEELELGVSPVHAYALSLDAPRAWLATSWVPVASAEAGLRALQVAREAPRSSPPAWTRSLPPAGGPAEVVAVVLTEDGASALELALPERAPAGLVVVADTWAPGWRARVDGAVAPVWLVGGAFRGVPVSEGARRVRLYYRPDGWIWGQWAAGAGLVLLVGLALGGWRRRRAGAGGLSAS